MQRQRSVTISCWDRPCALPGGTSGTKNLLVCRDIGGKRWWQFSCLLKPMLVVVATTPPRRPRTPECVARALVYSRRSCDAFMSSTLPYSFDHDHNLSRQSLIHLQQWQTEARNLQNSEPLQPDLHGYPRALKRSLLSTRHSPYRGKRTRTYVLLVCGSCN